jgi:excinuclease ABC subunit C
VVKAFEVLKKLGIKIEIIGIAKENEEIWFPHKTKPLIIGRDKPCLHLIQRLRDEAHRFAHSYQLIRRRMKLKVSKDKRN